MSDEKKPEPRMFTHRAFDKHPAVAGARAAYFKAVLMNMILITVTIWGVLAIYWSAPASHARRRLTGLAKQGRPLAAVLRRAQPVRAAPQLRCASR
jgi:hypothetical protein